MWNIIVAWRAEIVGCLVLACSWWFFRFRLRKPFWLLWLPGSVVGLANEFATEPEWTYAMQFYIWRDVSPFVIMGWGIVFAWVVTLSDALYLKIFKADPEKVPVDYLKIILTDLIVGVPLLLSNELVGLYVLKVWKYNEMLGWDIMLPIIHFPVEGLVCLVFFVLAVPNSIRFWKKNRKL